MTELRELHLWHADGHARLTAATPLGDGIPTLVLEGEATVEWHVTSRGGGPAPRCDTVRLVVEFRDARGGDTPAGRHHVQLRPAAPDEA